jgi:hypothetical protein
MRLSRPERQSGQWNHWSGRVKGKPPTPLAHENDRLPRKQPAGGCGVAHHRIDDECSNLVVYDKRFRRPAVYTSPICGRYALRTLVSAWQFQPTAEGGPSGAFPPR